MSMRYIVLYDLQNIALKITQTNYYTLRQLRYEILYLDHNIDSYTQAIGVISYTIIIQDILPRRKLICDGAGNYHVSRVIFTAKH